MHFWSVSSEPHCSDNVTSIKGLPFEHAVTAVAFAPFPHGRCVRMLNDEAIIIMLYNSADTFFLSGWKVEILLSIVVLRVMAV